MGDIGLTGIRKSGDGTGAGTTAGTPVFGDVTGALANTLVMATPSVPVVAYIDGGIYIVRLDDNVPTGATTLNISGVGAKSVVRFNTTDPVVGDMNADIDIAFIYDLNNDYFQSISLMASEISASDTNIGNIDLTITPSSTPRTLTMDGGTFTVLDNSVTTSPFFIVDQANATGDSGFRVLHSGASPDNHYTFFIDNSNSDNLKIRGNGSTSKGITMDETGCLAMGSAVIDTAFELNLLGDVQIQTINGANSFIIDGNNTEVGPKIALGKDLNNNLQNGANDQSYVEINADITDAALTGVVKQALLIDFDGNASDDVNSIISALRLTGSVVSGADQFAAIFIDSANWKFGIYQDEAAVDNFFAGNIGIGIVAGDGTLHVHSGSAGSTGSTSSADDLTVENSADAGITILSPDVNTSALNFGSPNRQTGAFIRWNNTAGTMNIGTGDTGADLVFETDLSVERMIILSSGEVGIGITTPSVLLHVNGGASAGRQYISSTLSANGSDVGFLSFVGNNSVAAETVYADMFGRIDTNDTGDEIGELIFRTIHSGALADHLSLINDGIVRIGNTSGLSDSRLQILDLGGVVDIDMNANGDSFIANNLGIGIATPSGKLDVRDGSVEVTHSDATKNVSLTPTSTGGVINVRDSSGVAVVTLDGRSATSQVRLQTAGIDALNTTVNTKLTGSSGTGFNFTNANRLGIGTVAPSKTLHVVGDLQVDGNVIADNINSKTSNIENPTASEDITIFRTNNAITVQEVVAVLIGSASPSVTYQLFHSTDRSAAGNALTTSAAVTSITTGTAATLSDATIPADSWIWVETTAQSGTVAMISIDIRSKSD